MDKLLDLTCHPGWDLLVSDLNEVITVGAMQAHNRFPDNDGWQEWRGKIKAYLEVIGYQTMVEQALAALEEQQDEDYE